MRTRNHLPTLILLLIMSCGCVQPIPHNTTPPQPKAVQIFEDYRSALSKNLIQAAEKAESGASEKQVRDAIAEQDKADRVDVLGPILSPIAYDGDYSGQRTATALRSIAAELGVTP